ncbi:unnamed protein product [[Actinomadura] parvosata subsp. kistnae]|uniref:Uncharacterized protein n=1 Tax=[Actinomadura] parvosata subsp. kistnae TaxID=1909395 RepID=A0A1U9ZYB3_9ACTN|nr:hypothetical protein [Nonomuraea sp. ATCC 55076]AQZ62942.1 hypothetical protein BKM31_17050 [Nonomuraea sp. ATCC 55076]SPL95839.1 unnamed protein product [Actinomadura parvosata subsp. kistnae]
MEDFGTGGGISVKIFAGDTTGTNTGWDIELEQARRYIDHLQARFGRPADWGALAGHDTPFVTATFGLPTRDPGAHVCVTLAYADGTEVRVLWETEINIAHSYLHELALLHGSLPDWSSFEIKGWPLADFHWADDGPEPLGT